MLVAIHQPNFFPWQGYFDKVRRADVFVFLDAVDYPRSGSGGMGSWCNRVKLNIQDEARWVTCPVQKLSLGAPISDAVIDDRQPWREKLLRTLQSNYARAPHYGAAMAVLEPLIRSQQANLASFNIAAITTIADHLGLQTRFVRQSELNFEGRATTLLISLVKAAGGTAYLAGGGAGDYQEDGLFADAGVDLVCQDFKPLPYGDEARFIPGLSVIDALMQNGHPFAQPLSGPSSVR
jgi:hypothetical protein